MGGRGKSSANAPTYRTRGGGPQNFADVGVIPLEQLESQVDPRSNRFEGEAPGAIAYSVELAVGNMLRSVGRADYMERRRAMIERVGLASDEMSRRPVAEREGFSARLAPLFARLREQAGEA